MVVGRTIELIEAMALIAHRPDCPGLRERPQRLQCQIPGWSLCALEGKSAAPWFDRVR